MTFLPSFSDNSSIVVINGDCSVDAVVVDVVVVVAVVVAVVVDVLFFIESDNYYRLVSYIKNRIFQKI